VGGDRGKKNPPFNQGEGGWGKTQALMRGGGEACFLFLLVGKEGIRKKIAAESPTSGYSSPEKRGDLGKSP